MVFHWFVLIMMLVLETGCSVHTAGTQPDKMDVNVFNKGTPRKIVIAECGAPVFTDLKEDGSKTDIYVFVQGYSDGEKIGRALFHATADVFTLGLWEFAGIIIEDAADGTEMKVEVEYDANDRIVRIQALKGEEKFTAGKSVEEHIQPRECAGQSEITTEQTVETAPISISTAKVNPNESWTGIWEVESSGQYDGCIWGLKQRGARVVSIEDNLNGNVNGMQLEGKIIQNNVNYLFTITLSSDGQSFEGKLMGLENKAEWLKGKRIEGIFNIEEEK